MPSILFPSRMFAPRVVDDDFAEEAAAARAAGFEVGLLDQERLEQGDFDGAAHRIAIDGLAVYRGWMLTVEHYAALHAAIERLGGALINAPAAYRHCHHLPASFDRIAAHSPRTVWIPLGPTGIDLDAVVEAAKGFGDAPVILKDYVKSRKHEWEDACFGPSAADAANVRRVASNLVERQGEQLTGGVVIRAFVPLESVGVHPKSGMPLTREHRVFVLDGEPLLVGRYWSEVRYADDGVPLAQFADVMRSIESRFYTMDVALGVDGRHRIIELGDAQVAGLLDTIEPTGFYGALADRLSATR